MALTAPPMGMNPRPGQDIAGLTTMLTGAADPRAAMNEALLAKLRPALRLLGDLEDLMTKSPEITPLVATIIQSKFGRGMNRGGSRQQQSNQGMPPVAPGMPGQPVPPNVNQLPPMGGQGPPTQPLPFAA